MVAQVGLLMNDEMHDFDPIPGRVNSVEPEKRSLSSMAPTILFKDGKPYLVVSSRWPIITSVLQMILNIIDFGMTFQHAIAAPRFDC